MSVLFSALYDEIRTACGDVGVIKSGAVDTSSYLFRDAVIDSAIKLALLDIADYSDDGSSGVTPDFSTDADRAVVIYYAAVLLLTPLVDERLQSTSLSIQKTAPTRALEFCVTQLNRFFAESSVQGAYDGSLAQILNHGTRWANRILAVAGTG